MWRPDHADVAALSGFARLPNRWARVAPLEASRRAHIFNGSQPVATRRTMSRRVGTTRDRIGASASGTWSASIISNRLKRAACNVTLASVHGFGDIDHTRVSRHQGVGAALVSKPNTEYDAATRVFAGVAFDLVGALEIQRLPSGVPAEYTHQLSPETLPNRHAAGPFCRFELVSSHSNEGVYAILVGSDLRYLGECADLSRRFGPLGYGHVSSRNCHRDGQATNCKINSKVSARQTNIDLAFNELPLLGRPQLRHQFLERLCMFRRIIEPGQEIERFSFP